MKYRFVVVGGGVYGCALAWHLARRGEKVVVLEAAEIASGSSGGIGQRGVRANRRAAAELPLMRLAYPLWERLADDLGADIGYERTGGLNLVEQDVTGTTGGLASLRARTWHQREHGIPTEVLDHEQVREYEPGVADAVRAALWCPLDGTADHTATTRAFAAAAMAAGAVIREHTEVTRLVREGGRVSAVELADGERIDVGEAVVLLNNTGVADLAAGLDVPLPLWWLVPQVLTVKAAGPVCRHLIGHDHRVLSMKPLDGSVMISGGWRGRWNPDTQRGEPIQDNVDRNIAEARAVFPALADTIVDRVDTSSAETCSVDALPIVDLLPTAGNVLIGTGWSGHGFAIAPAVATLLADWLTGHPRPDALLPFRYSRFRTPAVRSRSHDVSH
ncbi:NAD(P)/FAD-dependent oxidoreductase [Amycolatopsis palatopharyngis]|uniref:NAD(P)/FAD-dependent oxidoreductase n=1 Tax=Amycolatopsis palatopharyngis TaxID=187982 RepID=UPI000E24A64C|nr:FAD-binding oxidoreductase [Amycolatopsis palatopharyngis]